MNMTLSKRGDYVMRAAIFLARAPVGQSKKIREVVAGTEVPAAFASQILSDLVRAGLAVSKSGRDGGYQLSRDPSTITALDIVEAAEGPLATERCAIGEGPCKWDAVCPLHETWFNATQRVREVLANTTLAQLATRDQEIEEGTYLPADSHRTRPLQIEVSDVVQVECGAQHAKGVLSSNEINVAGLVESAITSYAGSAVSLETEGAIQPVRPPSESRESPAQDFQLAWRVRGSFDASHVEAELDLTPVDDQRCSLRIKALWHHEGSASTAADIKPQAERTVRFFLRGLAGALEESAKASSPH